MDHSVRWGKGAHAVFSIPTKLITPTPAFVTKSRKARKDNRAIATDASVDAASENLKLTDMSARPFELESDSNESKTSQDMSSDDRAPVILLEAPQGLDEVLEPEEPDQADVALQANGAYQTLRQSDEDITPVGTI